MDMALNIKNIKERIKAAAEGCGRNSEDILLVAASKTQPPEKIDEARECGISVFGENRVQELVDKYPHVSGITWHFIGHLQKNKVKYIVDKAELIHSVDNIELAEEIDRRSGKIGKIMPILIQINIGKEETKSGLQEEDLEMFCKNISSYSNILVSGLMAIPPAGENEEVARKYFHRMNTLFNEIKNVNYNNFNIKYLSMGMTGDFEVAIEEGANIVRVGTGIFGERNYNRRD